MQSEFKYLESVSTTSGRVDNLLREKGFKDLDKLILVFEPSDDN